MIRARRGMAAFIPDGQALSNGYICGTPIGADASGNCPPGFTKQLDPGSVAVDGGCEHGYDCYNAAGVNVSQASTAISNIAGVALPIGLLFVLPGWWKLLAGVVAFTGLPFPKNPDGTPVFRAAFYGGM